MIFVNSFWFKNRCSDVDVIAFINATGITDNTIISALCVLVTSLKNNGLWTKLSAIYPMVGGTAFSHKFNLKSPLDTNAAFRLAFTGGWVHSSGGALGNGLNTFANTFLTPSITLARNSTSIGYYSRTTALIIPDRYDMGAYNSPGGTTLGMLINFNNFFYSAVNDGAYNQVATTGSAGFYLSSRTASNLKKGYKNGIVLQNSTTLSTGIPTIPIYIGQFNNWTTGYSTKQCAFATIGSGLNDTESVNLYTIIQAFQTTLGRNV
jgi:hypothetical protein